MKFVWEMNEEKWENFADAIDRDAFDVAYMEGEFLGCCRTGDLCFDIRAWSGGEWAGWGFELFCGGVDTGYGYSTKESKYDQVNGYPYDEVDYGEFPVWFSTYSLKEFQEKAEPIFEEFIKEKNETYSEADLIAKANEPLHIW